MILFNTVDMKKQQIREGKGRVWVIKGLMKDPYGYGNVLYFGHVKVIIKGTGSKDMELFQNYFSQLPI